MKRTYKDGNEFFKDATKEAKKYSKDIKALEYTCTSDMTLDEIAEWEKEHNAVCLQFDNGGCLEIQYGEMYSVDEHGVRVIGNETPSLMFSLGEENLRYFRHLKGLKGEVFPVLKLNYHKKGVTAHPVGLREGMKIRNWMRVNFPEFTQLSQNKIEKLSEELINKAIIFE